MFSYNKIMFEPDSMTLVKMINETEEVWPMLYPVIQVIRRSFSHIPDYEEKHYLREKNKTANKIAKKTIIFVFNVPKSYSVVPKWLKFQVEYDKMLYGEQVG